MHKLLKILGWCAAGALVLALGAALALKILFPPEKLKTLALDWLSKQYNREFRIESVNAGFTGLNIRNFAVSEAGGFAKGEMLKADRISTSFKLAALLRKQLLVDSVEADGLEFNAAKYKDGRFNFSDLMTPPAKTPRSNSPKPRQRKNPDIRLRCHAC